MGKGQRTFLFFWFLRRMLHKTFLRVLMEKKASRERRGRKSPQSRSAKKPDLECQGLLFLFLLFLGRRKGETNTRRNEIGKRAIVADLCRRRENKTRIESGIDSREI